MPLRERNVLLLAAGFAPFYPERALDDPSLAGARQIVESILHAHGANPALAVDRRWTLVSANAALAPLLSGVTDPALLRPPVNVLRVSLHPGGMAPRIVNFAEWRHHVLERLRRQVEASADPALDALLAELTALPGAPPPAQSLGDPGVALPLLLDTPAGRLSLISTTTIFGTPTEVTLSELIIEAFYPADAETAQRLRHLSGASDEAPANRPA